MASAVEEVINQRTAANNENAKEVEGKEKELVKVMERSSEETMEIVIP